ncbi:hypothetical protein WJX72_011782 [[Myrmecia] bisecta]|uniref:Importin N-terminal domain-containing protein n=1 Tax=[Myrmecia] bisecta TaxID=41462 RepID=A0AAW1QSW3_9CHLO
MQLEQLCTVLAACLDTSPANRKAAEGTLRQLQDQPGHLVRLLQVAVEDGLDLAVRQVGAISFKNFVRSSWDPSEGPSPMPEADKLAVRMHLLEGIIRSPPMVRAQLGECLKIIINTDHPQQWPALLQLIVQNMASQDQPRLYGALYALRILARKYEFADAEERGPLVEVVHTTFPGLLAIFQGLLSTNSPTLVHADLLKLVCKTFWSVTYMGIPDVLLQPDQFAGWMTCLHQLVLMPVPQEGQPEDFDSRKVWGWWKVKKWALHISYRLFNRYGDPKLCTAGTDKLFAEKWNSECAIKFLEAHMQLIAGVTQGQYLSPRVVNLTLQYLTHAVSMSKTWKLLQPHIQTLLLSCVFPLMCFNEEDQQLWEDDPQEYIRKGYDIIEDMYSAKTAAMNFVHQLFKSRAKGTLDIFMGLIVSVFAEHQAALPDVPVDLARRMDGAMLGIGALYDVLSRKAAYQAQLEPMLAQYVVPMFGSAYGHLRAKACWVAGVYADIDFAEVPAGSQGTFACLFQQVVRALQDPDMPVRVDAVIALRSLIDAYPEERLAEIQPLVPQLLNEFFKLMSEVEHEDLVVSLESIVEKFGEDMAPYAVGLCQHLTAAFWRIQANQDEENEDDEDDMGALAAYGCLRALATVLESVSSLPHLFPQLEEIVFPVMQKMCSAEGQEIFEEILEIISYFTYFSPEISARMWSLWPLLYQCFQDWAVDYFENILVPLDNYISRGTPVFVASTSPNYLEQASKMAESALTNADMDEDDVVSAPKLLEVIIQNCTGRIDHCIGPYLHLVLTRLATAEKAFLQDLLINVVASALRYNAPLALAQLQQQGKLQHFFSTWFQMVFAVTKHGKPRHFRRLYDMKVNLLGLAAIMAVPDEALPKELAGGLSQLMAGTIKLLLALKEQQEQEERDGSSGSEDGSDQAFEGVSGDDGELDDDQDEEVDDAYLRRLAREAAVLKGERHADEAEESEEEWTDEEDVATPIDAIDPFVTFAETLTLVQMRQPHRFQALTAGLDANTQAAVQGMMQYAEQQRAKLQSAQAQGPAQQ